MADHILKILKQRAFFGGTVIREKCCVYKTQNKSCSLISINVFSENVFL